MPFLFEDIPQRHGEISIVINYKHIHFSDQLHAFNGACAGNRQAAVAERAVL
jgi:hypothetical protein